MFILVLLFLLFFVAVMSSFLYDDSDQAGWKTYFSMALVLVLMATFRPVGLDFDSENYVDMYNGDSLILAENSFVLISDFAYYACHSYRVMFFIYALLGISVKFLAIKRLTPLFFMSILVYLSYYYILHDLTQIRAGVASAFFLFSLTYLHDKRRGMALLMMLVSVFFHYSSLAYLPLLVFSSSALSKLERWILVLIVPAAYLIYFSGINLIMSIPIPFVGEKLELYQNLQSEGAMEIDNVNVFNMVLLVKIALYYVLLWKYEIIKEYVPIVSLLLRIYVLSIASLIVLSPLPVFAFRVSELYGVVEIVLFPLLYYVLKPEWISRLVVTMFALMMISINLFYNGLIRF